MEIGYRVDTNFSKRFLLVRRQNRYDGSTKPQEELGDCFSSSPFSQGLSKKSKERLPNNALCLRHSYLPTLWTRRKFTLFPLFFGVFRFCFCFFWGGVVGEGAGWRGKGRSISFDLRYFFPKVIFYIIPYVRAFLLIQYFFNWVFFFLPKMFRKPWKKSTCVTRWAFRLNLLPRDIVFLIFSLLLFLLKIVLRGSVIG